MGFIIEGLLRLHEDFSTELTNPQLLEARGKEAVVVLNEVFAIDMFIIKVNITKKTYVFFSPLQTLALHNGHLSFCASQVRIDDPSCPSSPGKQSLPSE